jgi:23S rRNA (cytosine1962-C5)-methyltransferase
MRDAFLRARAAREPLRATLPDTDCLRLFHGAVEGAAGLTVDQYGPLLLIQTFRDPLTPEQYDDLVATFGEGLLPVYNHRGRSEGGDWHQPTEAALADHVGSELGICYRVRARHRGQDPLLFLDFRVGRRWARASCAGCSVLNLFAYTGGIGTAAAVGGASEVWNLDFAASALAVADENAILNGVETEQVQADALPAMRQLSGLGVRGRAARRRKYRRFKARQFDRVILDPPTWATSPFGAVDIVRDYASLFKPALLACAPGGLILATNHVSTVSLDEWLAGLRRCAEKAGRPLLSLDVLRPEDDFPSPDGEHPLKIAVAAV